MDTTKINIPNQEGSYSIDFGDIYVVNEVIKSSGLYKLFNSFQFKNNDTLFALILFKLIGNNSNFFALKWWESSFAKYLFPQAELDLPRIADFLIDLGDKNVFTTFMSNYLPFIKNDVQLPHTLFDSSGLQSDINNPLSASSTNNSAYNHKVKLLVVNKSGLNYPFYYKYVAENIIDVSSLKEALNELESYGININKVVIGSNYCSESNIQAMYDKKIDFITKLSHKNPVYDEILEQHNSSVELLENFRKFDNKNLFLKKVKINLFNNDVNAFICLDTKKRENERQKFYNQIDKYMTKEYFNFALPYFGVTVLLSSYEIESTDLLNLYYSRQTDDPIFEFLKTDSDLLGVRYSSEKPFRGYLFLCFLCSIVHSYLGEHLKKINYTPTNAFYILNKYHSRVYNDRIIPDVAPKEVINIANCLKVDIPRFLTK
ncbi:MAG: hypothetical protein LBT86_01885 [Deltaproteobacteria bacterium]|jgi:hypothetical protein|nr:hypothetical protein [Deltaproteobacteria bacterium]